MKYNEINFHKRNRRPVTDTTYQIDAEEWNAIGTEMSRQQARLNQLDPSGALPDDAQHVTDAEFEQYKQNVEQSLATIGADIKQYVQELMTYDEFKALSPKLFKYYFVAQNEEDKARMRCWRIYLGKQLVGIFNVDGSVSLPRFPFRFPVRL